MILYVRVCLIFGTFYLYPSRLALQSSCLQIALTKGRLLNMKKEFQSHVKTDDSGSSKTDFNNLTKMEKESMPAINKASLWFLGEAPPEGKEDHEVKAPPPADSVTPHIPHERMGGGSSGGRMVLCCVLLCCVVLLTHTQTHTYTHTHTQEDEV